jgi:hypothetical protein
MDDIRDRFNVTRGNYNGPIRRSQSPGAPNKPVGPTQKPAAEPPKSFMNQANPPRPQQNNSAQAYSGVPRQAKKKHGFGPFAKKTYPMAPQATPAAKTQRATSPFAAPGSTRKSARTKRSKKKRILLVILLLLFFSGAGAGGYIWLTKKNTASNQSSDSASGAGSNLDVTNQSNQADPATGKITMLITGDFIAYDSVNQVAKNGDKYNYASIFEPMKTVFDKFDLTLCQQSTPGGGVQLGVSGYPIFNAPLEWNKALVDQGCDLVAGASRNAADKGQQAIDNAVDFYSDSGVIAYSGVNKTKAAKDEINYFEHKGVKFAFLSYTTSSIKKIPNDFSVNVYSKAVASPQLEKARENADFVIVAIDWGKPDDANVQPAQKTIAQELTTAGADLIVGSGPHITQYAEVLEGKEGRQSLVWYSLGNAVNTQLPAENLIGGIGVIQIDVATKNMVEPAFLPTYMHYEWTQADRAANRFDARKNLKWYPLDQAKEALAKSLLGTTTEAQVKRLKSIVTSKIAIKMLTTAELDEFIKD